MGVAYKDIIKSVSDNQFEILHNIQKLYLKGENFDCDTTFSKGGFYDKGGIWNIAAPKYKFDVYPLSSDVTKIEPFGKWPGLEINSLKSIVIDLPFVCSPKPTKEQLDNPKSCIIATRFHGYYPIEEMFRSYYFFLYNAYKYLKPGGYCIFKCQPVVSGGKRYSTHYYTLQVAESLGFHHRDEFILCAKSRLIGNIKRQEHARCFHSYFYVFQKNDNTAKTRRIEYFKWRGKELN